MKKIRKEEISGYIDPRLEADAGVLSSMYVRQHLCISCDDFLWEFYKDWFIFFNLNYDETNTITDVICEWQDEVSEDRYTAPKEESEYYYKLHIDTFWDDNSYINFLLFCEDHSDAKPYNIPKKKKKVAKLESIYDGFIDDDHIETKVEPIKPHEEEIIL